jgi:protein LTV1
VLASEEESKYRIEAMQNIPDSLRGFQPDMDPDLREVLEMLEDEEPQLTEDNSDTEDPEDIFAELVKGGVTEVNQEDDYDSDDTIKGKDITESEYLAEMAQYKSASKRLDDTASIRGGLDTESNISRTSNANTHRTSKQRRKRRQRLGGAYSEAGTDFSMTSSANYRNEGLTTLDERFDKVFIHRDYLILDSRRV